MVYCRNPRRDIVPWLYVGIAFYDEKSRDRMPFRIPRTSPIGVHIAPIVLIWCIAAHE